jgi:hypothetical protein
LCRGCPLQEQSPEQPEEQSQQRDATIDLFGVQPVSHQHQSCLGLVEDLLPGSVSCAALATRRQRRRR